MADFKYDGKDLRAHGNKIGAVDGRSIRNANGTKVGEVDGSRIRDANGSKVAEFDGKYLRDSGGSRVATMEDIKKQVEGDGGASLAALWWFFVR